MDLIKTHDTAQGKCPQCGKLLDRSTGVSGSQRAPRPGDFTVCVYCQTWLLFTHDLGLRLATDEDVARLDPESLLLLRMLTEHFANRG